MSQAQETAGPQQADGGRRRRGRTLTLQAFHKASEAELCGGERQTQRQQPSQTEPAPQPTSDTLTISEVLVTDPSTHLAAYQRFSSIITRLSSSITTNNEKAAARHLRQLLCGLCGYAVPDPGTVQAIIDFAGNNGILEVGAGRGFWAMSLNTNGGKCLATDNGAWGELAGDRFQGTSGRLVTLTPAYLLTMTSGESELQLKKRADFWMEVMTTIMTLIDKTTWAEVPHSYASVFSMPAEAALSTFTAAQGYHTLLLIWPPNPGDKNEDMALNSLKAFTGEQLVYIGEWRDGCTATDGFFDELGEAWQGVAAPAGCQYRPMAPSLYPSEGIYFFRRKQTAAQ